MLKVITVTNSPQHAGPLIRSLVANKWDYVVIEAEWKGFGTKLIETYNYLKSNPDVTEFIFCDAFDVLALGGEDEFREKLNGFNFHTRVIFSAEKGCWPIPQIDKFYKAAPDLDNTSPFRFVNSGLYYAKSDWFIVLIDSLPVDFENDDQLWATMVYLTQDQRERYRPIEIDCNQILFNSHSFIHENEYGYENGRLQILGNEPIFVHKNGRTVDEKLDNLMKL